MKVVANISLLFTELPLLQRIVAAAAAGFSAVEVQYPYEVPAIQFKEALAAAGLPLVLLNIAAPDLAGGGPGLAAVPARQAQFDQALQEALTYAAMVRPQFVNVLPGRLVEGVSREQALATLVGNVRQTAEAFQPLGIKVLSEAINPLDMPGFLINTPEHLLALIAAVDHANFAAQLDLYHMARQGLDLPQAIAALAGKIGHVQFADCPGRHQPGTGTVDFAGALRALQAGGYSGWLAAEYRPTANTQESLGWLAEWRDAGWISPR
ncbi:hydroxypyruvate isomerase family protein [Pseudomonas sp. TE3786]